MRNMNYLSHPIRTPNMGRPAVPACFDPSHSSLIDLEGINPVYNHLSDKWSCISVNAVSPYGDLVADWRSQQPRRPPTAAAMHAMDYEKVDGCWRKRPAVDQPGPRLKRSRSYDASRSYI